MNRRPIIIPQSVRDAVVEAHSVPRSAGIPGALTVRRSFGIGRTTVKTSSVPTADDALRFSLILASRGIGEVTVR